MYNMTSARLIPQFIYEESATKKYPLGFMFELQDGRKFAYGKNGGSALSTAGLCVTYLSTVGAHEDTVTVAHPVGTKDVVVTAAGTTVNQYEDGILIVTEGAGVGEQYRIKRNTAAASNLVTCTLYDGIATLWSTSTTDVDLWVNPWAGLVVNPTDAQQIPMGVNVIPMTASYYGWFQVGGIAALIMDTSGGAAGAELDEKQVIASVNTAGRGMITTTPANSDMRHVIGVLVAEADITDGTATLVRLTIR